MRIYTLIRTECGEIATIRTFSNMQAAIDCAREILRDDGYVAELEENGFATDDNGGETFVFNTELEK